MRTSESIDKLIDALSQAQGEISTVAFNKTNPHFKSRYADLSSIRDACKAPLSKHGLAILQSPGFCDGRVSLLTRIAHKSGQWVESELTFRPRDDTPQSIGSCITYGRRYAIISLLAIVADEDDDANGAQIDDPKKNAQKGSHGIYQKPTPQAVPRIVSGNSSEAGKPVDSQVSDARVQGLGFDPKNEVHYASFLNQCRSRGVPAHIVPLACNALVGKPSSELDAVLKNLGTQKTDFLTNDPGDEHGYV